MDDITQILDAVEQGDPHAASQLLPLVYDELRRLAAHKLNHEDPGQTLDSTALVHEAYLRLVAGDRAGTSCDGSIEPTRRSSEFANRRHFFAAAAEAMRRILIENARRKGRLKRGGERQRQPVDLDAVVADSPDDEVVALHEALERLSAHDPRKAKLVELRFFGGLTLAEAAECLDMSLSSADRDWRFARAWLYAAMSDVQDN
jgi:RNA polymerase sigma factor (sigma-70 family)